MIKVKKQLKFQPLTPERWSDLEALFGARGACGGCWCMLWRLKRSEFEKQKGDKNKAAFKAVVDSGEAPGILVYANGNAIGWCAFAPRESYPALDRSRVLKRIDDKPVWSIVCLFIAKNYRRKGVSVELLKAAAQYVRKRGGRLVEGYPVEPRKDAMPDVFAWTGVASAFLKAGFVECARRSETRPIMRRDLAAGV
jgi:GNAT superfamily N-acetyltransferase